MQEEISILETAASPMLPSKGLDGTSVQEHMRSVRGEDPALSSSHPGLRVNLSHDAQTIKENGFLQASLSMLPAIWTIAFIQKNVYDPSFLLCTMVECFLYFS